MSNYLVSKNSLNRPKQAPTHNLSRRFALCAFMLSASVLAILNAQSGHAADKNILHFPADKSVGTLRLLTLDPVKGTKSERRIFARGDVQLRPRETVRLELNWEGVEHPEFLPQIAHRVTGLYIKRVPFDDSKVKYLRPFAPNLHQFTAEDSDLTDRGIMFLRGAPELSVLNLSHGNVTGRCFETLATMPALYRLNLGYNQLKGADPSLIGRLQGLRDLRIESAQIGDTELAQVDKLTDLECLQIASNKGVTDKSMPLIARLPVLNELFLDDTSVTFSGLKSLKNAKCRTTLKKMSLVRLPVTARQMAEMRKWMPQAKLISDGTGGHVPLEVFAPLH